MIYLSNSLNGYLSKLSTSLLLYLPTRLPVYLSTYLFTCLSASQSTCLTVLCVSIFLHIYESTEKICNDNFRPFFFGSTKRLDIYLLKIKSNQQVSPSVRIDSLLNQSNRMLRFRKN